MKRNYYCLISGLPEWKWDDRKPLYNVLSFREMLSAEIHPSDMELVGMLYLPYDHHNILNRLYKDEKPFDERGNYPQDQVEAMTSLSDFDDEKPVFKEDYIRTFVASFLDAEVKPSRLQAEKELAQGWFALLEKTRNKFLVFYAGFEKLTRNIFTAMLGQKYNTPVADILVGESEIVEALKKSRSRDFGLTAEVEMMGQLISIFEVANLQEREIRFDLYRWNVYEEITFFNYFSIEKLLLFVIKLQILERWNALDEKQGREIFEKLVSDMQDSYEFPDDYKKNHGKKR